MDTSSSTPSPCLAPVAEGRWDLTFVAPSWSTPVLSLSSSPFIKTEFFGNSLVVQWLGLCTLTAKGPGSILGRGTKIPQATWQKKKTTKPEFFCALVPWRLTLQSDRRQIWSKYYWTWLCLRIIWGNHWEIQILRSPLHPLKENLRLHQEIRFTTLSRRLWCNCFLE